MTTNLPFDEWTEVFGSERLTGALLDRLTHHVHIVEMNGESYRLKGSRQDALASFAIAGAPGCRLAPRRRRRPPLRQGETPRPTGQAAAVTHHPGGTVLLRPSTAFVRP